MAKRDSGTNPAPADLAEEIRTYLSETGRSDSWLDGIGDRTVGVNLSTWESRLLSERLSPTAAEGVNVAFGACHDGSSWRATHHLGRSDLKLLANKAKDPSGNIALFVATQMWGSGTTNGRGPRYTAAALVDDRLVGCLTDTRLLARENDTSSAYQRFRVSGVGRSFFTKWFWSSTLDPRDERAPPYS